MTRRILVVDDDVRVHELIRWALRAPRFEVHAFADPQRALARVREIKPELIICDMMMPSMDGQVFLRLVKKAPRLRNVPFLFLTAVRLGSEVQAALHAGADAYLVKPFPLAKLVETVETVLEKAERRLRSEPESDEASTDDAGWPETRPEELLEMLAAPSVDPDLGETEPTRGMRIEAPRVPRAKMRTRGATALSATSLAPPPGRPDGAEATEEAPSGVLETAQEGPAPVFEGRFSTLELEIGRLTVVTQAESAPDFVVTTVLSLEAGGKGLKKIETSWCHPLHRGTDLEQVKRQIDVQHDRAVADARQGVVFGPRRDVIWRRDSAPPEDE